jgi:hypothetical protein
VSSRQPSDFGLESGNLARGGGALRRLVGEASAAGGVREDDALTDARG